MKTIFKLIFLSSFILVLFACKEEMGEIDSRLTAVSKLIEPVNAKSLELSTDASASLYFEWEACKQSESGVALYQIAFDKPSGDFSNPVYIVQSDNNGMKNSASISHKQINKIAGMMGIGPSEVGALKWTVLSSKGLKVMKASQENSINVTRLAGFDIIPIDVFVTGEASEGGNDLSKASIMKSVAGGEFEIYTKIEAGKPFKFVDSKSGTPTEYSFSGGKLVPGGTSTVDKTGIYKFYLDFNIGSYTVKEVTRVVLLINSSLEKVDLPYVGAGIWELKGYECTSAATDDRYKFRMESSTGETEWRAISNDSKPPIPANPAYYYMVEKTNVAQWTNGEIWKAPWNNGWGNKTYDFMFSLSALGPYTHNFVVK